MNKKSSSAFAFNSGDFVVYPAHGVGKIADIAKLAKVQLDGYKAALHIDMPDARLFNQLFELGGQTVAERDRDRGRDIDGLEL